MIKEDRTFCLIWQSAVIFSDVFIGWKITEV